MKLEDKIIKFAKNFDVLAKKCFQFSVSFCNKNAVALKNKYPSYKETALKTVVPVLIVVVGFHSCSSSQKEITRNVRDIFIIAEEIRSAYAEKPDYWGLSTDFAIRNHIIPHKYIKHSQLMLSGGLTVSIGSGKDSEPVMPRTAQFDISAHGLTKAQCISYTESILSKEQLLTLEKIEIINKMGDYSFTWGGALSLPVKKYAAKDLCAEGKNIVIWSIK